MNIEINDVTIYEEEPQHKGVSWWLENSVIRVIKRFFNESKEAIVKMFTKSVQSSIENFERDLIPLIKPFADTIIKTPNIPEFIKEPIRKALTGDSQAGLAFLALLIPALVAGLSQGIGGPVGRITEGMFDQFIQSRLLPPDLMIQWYFRGHLDPVKLSGLLRKHGYDQSSEDALINLSRPLFDDGTLTNLLWRGDITETYVENTLRNKGYTDDQIRLWLTLREIIPSPSDLVSIAVREGFNDSIASQFGYDENYPIEAAEWAEKGGMSQYFFKALWRAHWNLPGLVQVREMYHRGIVEEDELDTYLLAADYPVYWRDAIKQWMFSVVTRVDARRLYDLGIWDLKRVIEHNLELGYSPTDAVDMARWTALSYAEEERELTKTDILTMYRDGILNHSEATIMLHNLDYNEISIDLLLAHQDLKREEQYERAIIRNVKDLYIGGMYERNDVLIQLGKINTPPDVIRQNLAVWDLEKERKIVRPTVTQLRDMAQDGIITVGEWRTEMSNRRYNDKYIDWYYKLWLEENENES